MTYLLQVGRFSLLTLQGLERMYGQRDRIAQTLAPLIYLLAHQGNNQPSPLMQVTEGQVVVTLFLELELVTPQRL